MVGGKSLIARYLISEEHSYVITIKEPSLSSLSTDAGDGCSALLDGHRCGGPGASSSESRTIRRLLLHLSRGDGLRPAAGSADPGKQPDGVKSPGRGRQPSL